MGNCSKQVGLDSEEACVLQHAIMSGFGSLHAFMCWCLSTLVNG